MTAGGLVPSQTYKDLAARADNTAVLSIQRENGNGTKILRKSDISEYTKGKKKETRVVAIGAPAYRRTIE